jgi:hypothetical protein
MLSYNPAGLPFFLGSETASMSVEKGSMNREVEVKGGQG